MSTPDKNATGFLVNQPDPQRYENAATPDPDDVGAKLSNLIPRNARVLDVGCGTGSVSQLIARLTGSKVIGIEPDEARTRMAQDRGIDAYHGFLSDEFVKKHGPFDVVVFADVIEHLPNPAELIAIAKRGLTPGGSIVASVPNIAHWFVRTELLAGRFDYQDCGIMDATHLRWFTRKTIKELFERLGFEVTALDCTVNIELPDYRNRAPWRWMSPPFRRRLVGRLVRLRPTLFGCQHIVRATIKS